MDPLESALKYVRKHDLLRPGDRVGVAVSGGADSVALLKILVELRRELGIVLSVVHFNHKIRGAESDADEEFVRSLARRCHLELLCDSCDVKAYAVSKKLSLETAARRLRYQFFRKALGRNSLDKIATGHTLDDQAETVLLKLARGAGTRGLAGIYPKLSYQPSAARDHAAGAIVRPLLSTRRSEIEAYLRETGQSWREDLSNRDVRHTRNRIRHEILPPLQEQVNPRIRLVLAEAAEIARGEEEFWAEEVSEMLPGFWQASAMGGVLDEKKLRALPLAVQRRLVRGAAESLGLNIEFRHVEEVLSLGAEHTRSSLPEGWSAGWSHGRIDFKVTGEDAADYEYDLNVPGAVEVVEAGVRIEASLVSKELKRGSNQSRLDYAEVSKNSRSLVVRNWRAGDRFWPTHAKAPRKVKELLQQNHITGQQKKLWPVITDGDEVIWLRSFGLSRDSQKKHGSRLVIGDSPIDSS